MTYRELWRTLEPLYGNGEARAVTDYVLDVCFGLSKADIMCGAVEEMTAEKAAELNKIFGRLMKGEPVQYVLVRAEFCGRWFSVRRSDSLRARARHSRQQGFGQPEGARHRHGKRLHSHNATARHAGK